MQNINCEDELNDNIYKYLHMVDDEDEDFENKNHSSGKYS